MPLISKDGLLPIRPWNSDSRQLIISQDDVQADVNIDYGKIDLTTPWAVVYQAFTGRKLEKGKDGKGRVIYREPEIRPPPVKQPDTGKYTMRTEADPVISEYKKHNDAISELLKQYDIKRGGSDEFELAYKDLLSDVTKDGNVVNFRSEDDMRSCYDTIGVEYVNNNVIEMAGGLTYEKALDVLAHEYTAKLLRKKKPDFNHTKNEVLVTELGVAIAKEYLDKALSELKN